MIIINRWAALIFLFVLGPEKNAPFLDGDIIFHTSTSAQSQAIQLATKSKYSHMGILMSKGDQFYVFEAVQPVKLTPIDEWIKRGQNSHYVVKRLKNRDQHLGPTQLAKMATIGKKFAGKSYDYQFAWSDEKIYCSELVWKIYKQAVGIEIGKKSTLGTFDLTNKIVSAKLKERYGENIPHDEPVISPSTMFESKLLETVRSQ